MSNQTNNKPNSSFLDLQSHSSIYQKLPPDRRRQVEQAVIDRNPPTYQKVYEKFRLADCGISFSAFTRFARRLRLNAAIFDAAEMSLPEDMNVSEVLPHLLSQRLLETIAHDESATPEQLYRLTIAWRTAVATCQAIHDSDNYRRRRKESIASLDALRDRVIESLEQQAAILKEKEALDASLRLAGLEERCDV